MKFADLKTPDQGICTLFTWLPLTDLKQGLEIAFCLFACLFYSHNCINIVNEARWREDDEKENWSVL